MDPIAPISSWVHPTPLEIQSARVQLMAHEAQLLSLLAIADVIRSQIAALKQFIAPIRRVPPEILGQIIVLAATAPDAPVQVLRTLSSVCRFWRDTTLRTPDAWSKIHLKYDAKEPVLSPRTWLRTLPDVQEWFQNSGISKKDVRVSTVSMPRNEKQALIRLIGAHSDMLRSLAIDSASADDIEMLMAKSMPYLEEWSVYKHHSTGRTFPPSPLAPRLRRLSLDHNLNHLSLPQRTAITQLEVLPTLSSDRALLQGLSNYGGFPSLRVLDVFDVEKISRMPHDGTITLHSLEVLRVDLVVKSRMTRLFSHLKLPRLTTLALENAHGFELSEQPDIQSEEMAILFRTLIDTSNPPLRRLFLDSFAIPERILISALKRLPLLERLVLAHMRLSKSFPSRFIPRHASSNPVWICPRLSHIAVSPIQDNPELISVDIEDMGDLIDARAAEAERTCGAVARLQHVRVNDANMVRVDGRLSWIVDLEQDSISHPDIFRGAYLPVDRWWYMDRHILGSDLVAM
ncbi:hypothetical protein AURDEDRAFT_158902 [Auricularia subglabra TFB-10046 SS5]|nr:hypothetical protein AURDEDRAFT_158902 [Auricularia subglabra TFB-10046 SS5]